MYMGALCMIMYNNASIKRTFTWEHYATCAMSLSSPKSMDWPRIEAYFSGQLRSRLKAIAEAELKAKRAGQAVVLGWRLQRRYTKEEICKAEVFHLTITQHCEPT